MVSWLSLASNRRRNARFRRQFATDNLSITIASRTSTFPRKKWRRSFIGEQENFAGKFRVQRLVAIILHQDGAGPRHQIRIRGCEFRPTLCAACARYSLVDQQN